MQNINEKENVSSKTQPNDEQGENRSGRFSVAFYILLPVAGLTLVLFGRKHLFRKLMLQFDRNCISVFCPSLSKREKLLSWACNKLPLTWSSNTTPTLSGGIAELWKDGSLLCTLLNTAIPGACPNPHRHWSQPPTHAQALAYKYLGIIPIFTDEDLSGNLSTNLECSFINYLNEMQQAMDKISEGQLVTEISSEYVPRGMGLFSGEQHKKAIFYIYLAEKDQAASNLMVQIKGPYSTYGQALIKFDKELPQIPEVRVISDSVQNIPILKPEPKIDFSKYFKKYEQKHLGENIVIDVVMEKDRAKVTYVPKHYGMYEINIITNGQLLLGCPFNVHIFSNESEEEAPKIEEGAEKSKLRQKRRVISKTIDFIDEEIPLAELKEKYQTPEPVVEEPKAPEKPKFNFIEVVEEITKNNEEFKHILDMSQTSPVTESCVIEEQAEPNADEYFEPIIQEAEFESFLEVDAARQFEIEEVDGEDCVINYNVEIQMPVIEEAEEQGTNFENDEVHVREVRDMLPSEAISTGNETIHNELYSKNYQSKCKESKSNNIIQNSPSNNLEDRNSKMISENGSEVCDGPEHSDDLRDPLLHNIDEDKNFVSVSDNENNSTDSEQQSAKHRDPSSRTDIICNVNLNNDISSKHGTITDNKSNVNNQTVVSMFSNQTVINSEEEFVSDNNKAISRIGSKYMNNNVNRIKIPEKFVEHPKTIVKNNLENKYFSQKISNSERRDTKVSNKVENGMKTTFKKKNMNDEDILLNGNVGTIKEKFIPSRFFPPQDLFKQYQSSPFENTSPICHDHIVPEVEYLELSVADRRKIFAQYSRDSVSSSKNSSFSETENTDGSRTGSHYESLSVLNVLDTLKLSNSSSIVETCSLSSTKSLPDISLESDGVLSDSVKDRKSFWENVSRSSSFKSLTPVKKITNELNDVARSKLIWRKPTENTTKVDEITIQKSSEIYKSADDILSMTENLGNQNSKNYKSLDNSLDECDVLTIDERKKMLLKQNYEAEKQEREKLRSLKKKSLMLYDSKNINRISESGKFDKQIETRFSPIGEIIKKYNSASKLPTGELNNNTASFLETGPTKPNNTESLSQKDLLDSSQIPRRVRSQFKRAIKYFQKLEEKSQGKTKPKSPKGAKQLTLDITKKEKNKRKGGSLNLPNISDRFSVNNLYEDVFGNRKGSFKGAPNRTALVEALATFSRKDKSLYDYSESEDDIKYEIFKNHIKRRKRRSFRSIFDVFY